MAADNTDLALNTVLGEKYRVERLIASGGMGSVYEATHIVMNRRVAVKLLNRVDESALRRFERECRALSAIDNDAVPKLFGWGVSEQGCPYLVMELIEGESLEEVLAADATLDPEVVRSIAIGVCVGLEAIHGAGLVHRDIKPDNILVEKRGDEVVVKVTDLGIAGATSGEVKVTMTNAIIGSIDYMSPEHYKPASLEQRSDIFSLGCVMYRALSGRPPFAGHSPVEVAMQLHANNKAELPPSVPPYLNSIIQKCLTPDVQQRFESASQLKQALIERQTVQVETPKTVSGSSAKKVIVLTVIAGGIVALLFALAPTLRQSENTDNSLHATDELQRLAHAIPANASPQREVQYIASLPADVKTKVALLRLRMNDSKLSNSKLREIEQHRYLGVFLREHSQFADSKLELEGALKDAHQAPDYKHLSEARAMIELGRTLIALKDYEPAKANFATATKLLTGDEANSVDRANAQSGEGVCLLELGLSEEAISRFTPAEKIYFAFCLWDQQRKTLEGLLEIKRKTGKGESAAVLEHRLQEAALRQNAKKLFALSAREVSGKQLVSPRLDEMARTVVAFEGVENLKEQQLEEVSALAQHVGNLYWHAKQPAQARDFFRKSFRFASQIDTPAKRSSRLQPLCADVSLVDQKLFKELTQLVGQSDDKQK